MMFEPRMWPVI